MALLALFLPMATFAQNSSINTFSPYTFYGIGDFSTQGTANLRSMGGIGVAYRDMMTINYLNPASYSTVGQKSFLFNFGLEGQNFYLKGTGVNDKSAKTAYNTFNVRDVAILFPLARKLGFGFSVTPLSSVGYRVKNIETDPNIVGNLGHVAYTYEGEGGVSQIKAGLGWEPFKRFSIGAEMVYYLGSIERTYNTEITPITSSGSYSNSTNTQTEEISRVFANFGIQYDAIRTNTRLLTIGATYQLGGKLDPAVKRYVPANDIIGDTVFFDNGLGSKFKLPSTLSVGAFYQTTKYGFGVDYVYQKWSGLNENDAVNQMKYVNSNTIKVGGMYTPNPYDVRRFMNRITYRVGFRYSGYYMQFRGQNITEKAVTLGVGIPVEFARRNSIDIGVEYGQRGTTRSGLIRERFVNFSIGLSLFGSDYWFVKQKYD